MFIRDLHGALVAALNEGTVVLPSEIAQGRLHVFSDYSDRLRPWGASVFLCAADDSVRWMTAELGRLRHRLRLDDGRRFEYKSFRDRLRWQAVEDWLSAFDALPGLVLVLLVHRDVESILKRNELGEREKIVRVVREQGLGDWATTSSGPRLVEEALRVVHSVGYLHAALGGAPGRLHWISDNDEILDGALRKKSVEQLLAAVAEKYAGQAVQTVITTESDLGSSPVRDFLSIPDLVAAAVVEHQMGVDEDSKEVTTKAGVIARWFKEVDKLQKLAFQVKPGRDTGLQWKLYRPYIELPTFGRSDDRGAG